MAEGDENLPRDAKIVKTLLKSMGVDDYEPRVMHQFLELWHRYVADVLTDAQVYSEHAGKSTVDCDDLKLAIQSKVNFSFSQPPPREVLLELARSRNKIPMPKKRVGGGPGILLPQEQDTLIRANYQLEIIPKKQAVEETEEEEDEEIADPNSSSSQQPKPEIPLTTTTTLTPQRVSFPLAKRPK
ncbi:transcription initiation factor TFIID subunit 9-like isoform X2 [Euphorbia lathyris]